MELYRLTAEGGAERFSGRILHHNGRVYVNPTPGVLTEAGYKPLLRDSLPADAGETDREGIPIVYACVYTDEGDAIRLSYERRVIRDDED